MAAVRDIGELLRLAVQGFGNHVGAGAEHIAVGRQLVQVNQARHGGGVGFQAAVGQNMRNGDAAFDEETGHQQGAVTFQRLFFGAEQGDLPLVGGADDAAQAVVKEVGFGDPLVPDAALGVVAGTVGGPAAQLPAQVGVGDADVVQRPLQVFVVEVGSVAAVRGGTDINHFVHAMAHQQVDERLRRVVGMADGEDGALGQAQYAVLNQGLMMVAMSL